MKYHILLMPILLALGLIFSIFFGADASEFYAVNEENPSHKHGGKTSASEEEHDHSSESGDEHDDDAREHDDHHDEHNENNRHEKDEEHDDHAEDDHGHGSEFGENTAIQAVREEGSYFQLSPEATQTLKLSWQPLKAIGKTFFVPNSALVTYQNNKGIYVYLDGWFHLVDIEIENRNRDGLFVKSSALSESSFVVTQGVPFLRVAHLQASGQGGKGHAH